MKFAKAHGLGNDFLLVEESGAPADSSRWVPLLCERHTGAGADGVVLYRISPDGVGMRLINADGGEVEISGNGMRCLAAYAASRRGVAAQHVIQTAAGPRVVQVTPIDATRFKVRTDLGDPILESARIPLSLDPPRARVVAHSLDVAGRRLSITATSLGNPHCAVFVDHPPDDAEVGAIGGTLETHALFPRRTNVEFITVLGSDRIRVRFWERGVGYTRASGTGAASAVVACILNGRTSRHVTVVCDGGELDVEWPDGGSVRQVGAVELVFEGEWLSGAFANAAGDAPSPTSTAPRGSARPGC